MRDEGNCQYVYAYNDGGAANLGAPVILTATSGYSFHVTWASGADTNVAFLGVVNNATCPAASYCWIATRGIVNAYVVTTAVLATDYLRILDGGGKFRVASFTSLLTRIVGMGLQAKALSACSATYTGVVAAWIR
jgi:hypothetical protein